ncbi:hypothetical protein EHQ19_08285 [Leptospira montravelensis]|uniref:hypothetical protein n=1 Tax=Leptospira montravelensis TaxID=2484961 RepID=UPI001083A658|nr:hypothetical protein [Leptospira montravelensis]TGK82994.1 hypothetical protein EHQ19_08285 [Leptospira montravelensis]
MNPLIGFKGIRNSIKITDILKNIGFRISLLISILTSLALLIFPPKEDFLSTLIDMVINSYPSLLGFMVGGYALIVGFGNKDLIKRLSENQKGSINLFSSISSKYAYSILVIAFTLFLSWNIKLLNYLLQGVDEFSIYCLSKSIFYFEVFLILFLSNYSLFQVFYIVTNTFTFGELNSSLITLPKPEKKVLKSRKKKTK